MEPARDERGDSLDRPMWTSTVEAAMEPARDERGDPGPHEQLAAMNEPQWSPLAMSGATFIVILPSCTCSVAAMEPARDERGDDGKGMVHAIDVDKPQWSPLAMSGATRVLGGQLGRVVGAAMEPARDERGDHVCDDRHHWLRKPQWSPLAMSGATPTNGRTFRYLRKCRNGARSR